jgi:hypothetical protein
MFDKKTSVIRIGGRLVQVIQMKLLEMKPGLALCGVEILSTRVSEIFT